MERVATGVPGLDEILNGGIPKGSNVLLAGGAGTGKTIFSTQYLYNGAAQYGEAGLFVTLEGNVRDIAWNMESFQWDIKTLQNQGLFTLYRLNLGNIRNRKYLLYNNSKVDIKQLSLCSAMRSKRSFLKWRSTLLEIRANGSGTTSSSVNNQ